MNLQKLKQALDGIRATDNVEVKIEASINGVRVEQSIQDVLTGGSPLRILLVSQEAIDADPLLSLPVMNLDKAEILQ